jgi:hypothetical protein
MIRFVRAAVLGVVLCSATSLQAQVDVTPPRPQEGWSAVRIAKWALLGAAIGFGSYALIQSGEADDHFSSLRRLCQVDPESCQLQNGRYAGDDAERLYDAAGAADRRARVGIIGGQITLMGSAALFVYDLRNGRGPDDIPYPPTGRGMAMGLRLAF